MPSIQLSFWISEDKYQEFIKNKSKIRDVLRDRLYVILGQKKKD